MKWIVHVGCGLSLWLLVWAQITTVKSEACEASVCPSAQHSLDSQAYFIEANMQYEDGAIKDSLPFYRAAVRICPGCGLYWMQLGEAELRLGLRGEAKTRLLQAQGKAFSNEMKIQKLLETELQEVEVVIDPWIQNSYPALEQLPKENANNDNAKLVFGSHPWVIRNAFQVERIRDLIGYEKILSSFGEEPVDYYPQNMKTKPNRVYHSSLQQAVEFLEYPLGAYLSSDISKPGTYIQWNINSTTFDDMLVSTNKLDGPVRQVSTHLQDFFDFLLTHNSLPDIETYRQPHVFAKLMQSFGKKAHWYMVLIGEAGSGMFMHTDNLPVASWQMQIEGNKRWVLCQPIEENKEHSLKNCKLNMNNQCMLEDSCQEVVLEPGDMLYYPAHYWHYTSCLSTPTMSVSGTVLHQHRPDELVHLIRKECIDNKLGYSFDSVLCMLVQHVNIVTQTTAEADSHEMRSDL